LFELPAVVPEKDEPTERILSQCADCVSGKVLARQSYRKQLSDLLTQAGHRLILTPVGATPKRWLLYSGK
jgi:hypothetical protein